MLLYGLEIKADDRNLKHKFYLWSLIITQLDIAFYAQPWVIFKVVWWISKGSNPLPVC